MPGRVVVRGSLKGYEAFKKNLQANNKVVKVGILESGNNRSGGKTNADIGAKHEFGSFSENIPRRSFLKDPLELKRQELLNDISKYILSNTTKDGGGDIILRTLGILAEGIVKEAFGTGGYGLWQPLTQTTINKKGSSSILIDSGQLRKSITSRVDKKNS